VYSISLKGKQMNITSAPKKRGRPRIFNRDQIIAEWLHYQSLGSVSGVRPTQHAFCELQSAFQLQPRTLRRILSACSKKEDGNRTSEENYSSAHPVSLEEDKIHWMALLSEVIISQLSSAKEIADLGWDLPAAFAVLFEQLKALPDFDTYEAFVDCEFRKNIGLLRREIRSIVKMDTLVQCALAAYHADINRRGQNS